MKNYLPQIVIPYLFCLLTWPHINWVPQEITWQMLNDMKASYLVFFIDGIFSLFNLFLNMGRFFFFFCYCTRSEEGSRKESHILLYCIGSEFAPPSGRLENDENTAASIKNSFIHQASMNIVLFVRELRVPISFSENS